MYPMRSGYKQLGLEPIDILQDWPHQTQRIPMGEENIYDGQGYLFKLFLEEVPLATRERDDG
jgi:hypothetical protein